MEKGKSRGKTDRVVGETIHGVIQIRIRVPLVGGELPFVYSAGGVPSLPKGQVALGADHCSAVVRVHAHREMIGMTVSWVVAGIERGQNLRAEINIFLGRSGDQGCRIVFGNHLGARVISLMHSYRRHVPREKLVNVPSVPTFLLASFWQFLC